MFSTLMQDRNITKKVQRPPFLSRESRPNEYSVYCCITFLQYLKSSFSLDSIKVRESSRLRELLLLKLLNKCSIRSIKMETEHKRMPGFLVRHSPSAGHKPNCVLQAEQRPRKDAALGVLLSLTLNSCLCVTLLLNVCSTVCL